MANLNTFADPSATNDPIPGSPIPISLIASPFAAEIANVATGGRFTFDGNMNPLDLFQTFHPASGAGVAVLIMNSLSTPLTLVESYQGNLDDYDNGPQLGYPAVIDASNQNVVKAHQIPGVRKYPRASLHKAKDGSPALLGGLGLYRFEGSRKASVSIATRSLAFTCTEDGTSKDPLIGVAFDYRNDRKGSGVLTAVTVDLSKQGKPNTQANLKSLQDATQNSSIPYEIGSGTNTMTIWGVVPPGTPVKEQNMVTVLVWVRDVAATFPQS